MNVALLGSRPIVSPTDIHRVGLIAACTWAGRDHVALVAAIPDMRAVVTAIGSPRPRRARQAH